MKTLYLQCAMGAAGDMLMAALYELLDEDGRSAFLKEINGLGIAGVQVQAVPTQKCGIWGTHMRVLVHGQEEHSADIAAHDCGEHTHSHDCDGHTHSHDCDGHTHSHDCDGHAHSHDCDGHAHSHDCGGHAHSHSHSSLADISHLISHLPISQKVRQDAQAVYGLIAEAESHAHGQPVSEIHFHEVGALDAVLDVLGVCLLMERIGAQKVLASPVHVGSGQVRCAHGVLPVPAPATAHILRGVPIYGGQVQGESVPQQAQRF